MNNQYLRGEVPGRRIDRVERERRSLVFGEKADQPTVMQRRAGDESGQQRDASALDCGVA